jgi:serine/threonine protein kinase
MNKQPKIGEIFDERYEILEILGEGGMGTVLKAVQLDCRRLVALKLLHQEASADPEFRARFLREAQALSKLCHANIVTVYHLGLAGGSQLYLAMEYLEGQSLRAVLARAGHLSVVEALRIAGEAARALQYTHLQGIVHRDLKPENILLVAAPLPNTVKLVDFGFARLSDGKSKEQKITSTGEIIGSSSYMSPEQFLGRTCDHRTDIYSLSACLYEMLAGRRALDADTPIGNLYRQMNVSVPVIRKDQVDRFHPRLNEIILRGLAREQDDRYASMQELSDDIEAVAASLPSELSVAAGRRMRVLLPVILFAGLLLLALAAPRILSLSRAKQAGSDALVLSAQDKMSRQIIRLKAQVDSWKNPGVIKSSSLRERYLNDAFALGRLQLKSVRKDDFEAAEKTYGNALRVCQSAGESFSDRTAACLTLRARAEWKQGKAEAAGADFERALKLVSEKGLEQNVRQDILAERAMFRFYCRRFPEALQDFNESTEGFWNYDVRKMSVTKKLDTMTVLAQRLDKGGDNRLLMRQSVAAELLKMKPQSSLEAVQMVRLANGMYERLLWFTPAEELIPLRRFSESLLQNMKGTDELKAQTRLLFSRVK